MSREDGCRGLLCAHLDVAEELYEPPVAVGAHEACLTLEAGSLSLCEAYTVWQTVDDSVTVVDIVIYTVPHIGYLSTVALKVDAACQLHTVLVAASTVLPDIGRAFHVEHRVFTSVVFPAEVVIHLVHEVLHALRSGKDLVGAFG